jgi:hypothetical protein
MESFMQTQLVMVFLANALVLMSAHAQQTVDASCERYASSVAVFMGCDAREFVEPVAPATDLGLEEALAARVEASKPDEGAATDKVPRSDAVPNPVG